MQNNISNSSGVSAILANIREFEIINRHIDRIAQVIQSFAEISFLKGTVKMESFEIKF
jgi:hypothetical protein